MICGYIAIGRDCTQPQKERACYQCGETGHLARDCPSQGAGNMNGGGGGGGYQARGAGCYKCGKVGHIARDCSQVGGGAGGAGAGAGAGAGGGGWYEPDGGYGGRGGGGQTCFSCGGYGHTARDCTQGPKCYNCMSPLLFLPPFFLFWLAMDEPRLTF